MLNLTGRVLDVEVKQVYGKTLVYPACDDSRSFANLIDAKTFTKHQMNIIEGLGYSFQVKTPTL